jgi:uncharacterized SAM-binding protein YcdF (DUF218 family)
LTPFSPGGLAIAFFVCAVWVWRSPRSLAVRRTTVAVALVYLLASIYVVPATIAAALLTRRSEPFNRRDVNGRGTAIVLLGGSSERVEGHAGAMSLMLPPEGARVLEAARVFSVVSPDWIISSGGAGPEDKAPSSVVMRDALVRLGVPASRIVLESSSRTTHDEAVLIAPMLAALGARQTILVTSAIHMPRSLGTFRAAGVSAIAAPADDSAVHASDPERWRPSARGLLFSTQVVHECAGLVYYWLRGWWVR